MQKLIILIAFCSCSSVGQPSILGEWTPTKVTVYNAFNNATSVYYDRNHKLDTLYFKDKLDKDYLKADSAKLCFEKDSVLFINSYGIIIPTSEPGWHFGDKVGGNWTRTENKLKFIISDDKTYHLFFYKIITNTHDSLVLGMTAEDYGQVYMTLEFARH